MDLGWCSLWLHHPSSYATGAWWWTELPNNPWPNGTHPYQPCLANRQKINACLCTRWGRANLPSMWLVFLHPCVWSTSVERCTFLQLYTTKQNNSVTSLSCLSSCPCKIILKIAKTCFKKTVFISWQWRWWRRYQKQNEGSWQLAQHLVRASHHHLSPTGRWCCHFRKWHLHLDNSHRRGWWSPYILIGLWLCPAWNYIIWDLFRGCSSSLLLASWVSSML